VFVCIDRKEGRSEKDSSRRGLTVMRDKKDCYSSADVSVEKSLKKGKL